MRVTRIRLTNVRHRDVDLDSLTPGLNLIVGPNGVGKSSLVEAIRCAFLERFGTTTVKHLQGPDSGSGATVEVNFEWNGKQHALKKTFLKKNSCVLDVDGRRLQEDGAESYLAELLGYDYGLKGSRADLFGIPGLLWVQQGTSQDVQAPVKHAGGYLRGALQSSVREVSSSDGDALIDQVATQRGAFLTQKGQPRGKYEEALTARDNAREELDTVKARATQFRETVNRLIELQDTVARLDCERPWVEAEALAEASRSALAAAAKQKEALETKRNQLREKAETQRLIGDRLTDIELTAEALVRAEGELPDLADAAAAAEREVAHWEAQLKAAADACEVSRGLEQNAHQARHRDGLLAQQSSLREGIEPLRTRVSDAIAANAEIERLMREVALVEPQSKALPELRALQTKVATLRARLDGVASSVAFDLRPGVHVATQGREISGSQLVAITEPTQFEIDQVGKFTVIPGGKDVAAYRDQLEQAQRELDEALRAVSSQSVEQVQEAAHRYEQLDRELTQARALSKGVAPAGLPALEAQLARQESLLTGVEAELAGLPASEHEAVALNDARQRRERAEGDLENARNQLTEVGTLRTQAVERGNAKTAEVRAYRDRIESVDAAAEKARLDEQLRESTLEVRVLKSEVDNLDAALAAAMPDAHERDLARYERSAKNAREERDRAAQELQKARFWVESNGALGVDEQVAQRERDVEQAERRVDELARQARAWDHLFKLLDEERRQLTQQLQEPLKQRVDHYLRLLFPQGGLTVDDDLSPHQLRVDTRDAGAGQEFSALSFGTREQIGIVSRIAYADLLRDSGKPTLLILDDVLNNSDDRRLQAMMRVLDDAAQRHQILLLSCQPERWRHLGVPLRRLDALEAA